MKSEIEIAKARVADRRIRARLRERREADPALMAEYRERQACSEAKRRAKIAADPAYRERRAAQFAKADRKKVAKRRTTEEGREQLRAKYRRKWDRLVASPEKHAEHRAKQAARWLRMPIEKRREKQRRCAVAKLAKKQVRQLLSQATRIRALRALIPKWLPRHAQDDVLSDLALAMLEGKCSPDMVRETINKAVTRHNSPLWRELSLDAPVPGMEGVTYLDMLESGEE